MRRVSFLLLPLGLAVAGCGSEVDPDAPLRTYEERDVLFVDAADVRSYLEAGNEVVFVDNRSSIPFQQQRIAGARLMPTNAMERSVGSLPLNRWIVLYCT